MPPALHLRSSHSLLRSAWDVGTMAAAVARAGFGAGALCDWNSIAGAVAFWQAMAKAGCKPLLGCELEVRHPEVAGSILLLAENDDGYRSLCRILTRRGRGLVAGLEDLRGRVDGLVALASGREGVVHHLVAGHRTPAADGWLASLVDVFGADRVCLGLPLQQAGDLGRARLIEGMAGRAGIPLVAAMEFRYEKPEDHRVLRALASVGTLTLMDEEAPGKPGVEEGYHLVSAGRWREAYRAWPQAVEAAQALVGRCRVPLLDAVV